MSKTLPLAGTVVLDLSRMHPGGFCTRLLSDLGAEVVKVEAPGGDYSRYRVGDGPGPSEVALHRGKRSITLDLKHPRAPEVLHALVQHADVLVESARPGSMAEAGIGYPQLSAVNPALVWCSISGFGQTGPYQDLAGHDISYLGQSGVLGLLTDVAEGTGQPRLLLGAAVAGMTAALGITAALAARRDTGRGCEVDASIAGSALWLLTDEVTRACRGIPAFELDSPSRQVYECGDGRLVSVAAAEGRTWAALVRGLGLADLGDRPGGPAGQEASTAQRIAEAFRTAPAAHWVDMLGRAAVVPVNDLASLADDPQIRHRGAVTGLNVGTRTDQVVTGPLRFRSGGDWFGGEASTLPSALGADVDEVLARHLSADEIASLRRDGVFGPTP